MTLRIVWATLSLCATVLAAYNLREAFGDRHFTRKYTTDPVVLLAADAAVRRMLATLIIFGTFLAIGAAALLWPGRGLGGYITAGGLVLSLVVMVADTVARTLARRAMQRVFRRQATRARQFTRDTDEARHHIPREPPPEDADMPRALPQGDEPAGAPLDDQEDETPA
jgi:hypothetical protein